MSKKNAKKGKIATLIIGLLFIIISIIIHYTDKTNYFTDKGSEFFIVGLIMVILGISTLFFKVKINFG